MKGRFGGLLNLPINLKLLLKDVKSYSVLKLFTGFAIAAFIAWKLTVIKAINITSIPADANNHQLSEMR